MAKQGAKTAVPRLRFPEFREGLGWQVRPLGVVCEVQNNRRRPITSSDRESGPYPYYGASGVVDSISDYIFDERLLLVGEDGAKWEAFEKTAFIAEGKYWVNNHAHVLKATEVSDSLLENYLTMLDIAPFVTGAAPPKLTLAKLKSIPIPVPPTPAEQQRIADCLTSLDEVIVAQGRKVEALKAHKRGLMHQFFPREGETRPRFRFPEFRDAPEWTRGKASDIVDVLQGYGFPERLQGSREGEFPFYKVSDISACVDAGGVLLGEAKNHIDAYVLEELRAKLMPVGSTVFAKIGEAIRSNKRAITSRPCLVDNNAAGVKAITGVAHHRFVYYLWCQIPLIEYAGGVVPAVNKSAMEQIPVCYPEFEEQQRIADCLSSLDIQITAETSQLAALKTHKRGLMQQLFPMLVGG